MRNIKKKISALALTAVFASMQVSAQLVNEAFDTGLGVGNGGASINFTEGGFAGSDFSTDGSYNKLDLNFNGNTHVNWETLNINSNEILNFNAVDGATNVNVLNTVNTGMSNIYGQINANSGIGKLIISNPNGVLFDGASFTATGDVMLTTQPMTSTYLENGALDFVKVNTANPVGVITIQDSAFNVGGEFNILAPSISLINTEVTADNKLKLITANGQDYLSTGNTAPQDAVKLEAVNINGDVYIIADKGIVKTVTGGEIKGNLNIQSDDSVALNYVDNGKALYVTGDTNVVGNGVLMYARNTKVDGNLNMENGGGFLEVGNVQVGKDMNLTTVAKSENAYGYKHFTHVIGDNTVGGNVNINSKDNIHIGNYNFEEKVMLDGSLTVGGDLTAHAQDGHVTVTIDTKANKIDLKSDNYNVLTDGKAVLTANEYKFASKGYIGGIEDTDTLINTMENYIYYPAKAADTNSYVNIAGGNVTMVETNGEAYIASIGDMDLTGANANKIYLTSYGNDIQILGDNVHADEINVGGETDTLRVEFPGRDYTLKYTNIRDAKEVTVGKNEVITYELTNGENGYNTAETRAEKTTYLIGPDKETPVVPPVEPEPPVIPEPPTLPNDDENIKILKNLNKDTVSAAIDANPVYTPIAYAADLEDDQIDAPIRKNVDGSVTVVRAFPMIN